jgi:hypothetical protein
MDIISAGQVYESKAGGTEPTYRARLSAQIHCLREPLVSALYPQHGEDAHDIVGDAIALALQRLHEYDPATGSRGLLKWLQLLCRWRASFYRRRKAAEIEHLEDLYWRKVLSDRSLGVDEIATLRLKLQHTALSETEREVVWGKVVGEARKETAARLCLSTAQVKWAREAAVRKLSTCPVDGTADLDHYQWRGNNPVSVYHKPTSQGAQLARERLKALK